MIPRGSNKYDKGFPSWVKRDILRWKREYGLDQWRFRIMRRSQQWMRRKFPTDDDSVTMGACNPRPEYLECSFYISSAVLNERNSFNRQIVAHEVLHCYFAEALKELESSFVLLERTPQDSEKTWQVKSNLDKLFRHQIGSAIERLIEQEIRRKRL